VNVDESRVAEAMPEALANRLAELDAGGVLLSAKVGADIAALSPEEQVEFLKDLGLESSALDRFIRAAYELLDLISYFTVGTDEVRAWTIERGTRAKRAAGKIHSDLERGFIRAEVIPYVTFIEHGSENAVKSVGKLQIEGAEYIVQDGDLMNIRFNV
jgi:ribosome-binding ATPase YchF (GTP1/OBG family)